MDQFAAFSKPGNFYKGNIHLHSTNSDGRLTPAEVIDAYKSRGYDFVSLTDHFLPRAYFKKPGGGFITVTDTTNLRSDDFTTILGAEIHGPGQSNGTNWHIVAVGLPADFAEWDGVETGAAIAERALNAGAFVSMAHPAASGLTIADADQVLPFIHSVEVYNHGSKIVGAPESWHYTDTLLRNGARFTANATDDAHLVTAGGLIQDAFGGWIQVRAESLDPDLLLAALKAGEFYSSMGPEIHDVAVEGDDLVIRCSPVLSVLIAGKGGFQWKFADGKKIHDVWIQDAEVDVAADEAAAPSNGEEVLITEVRFPYAQIQKMEYGRITIVDRDGKYAWSNPFWFD